MSKQEFGGIWTKKKLTKLPRANKDKITKILGTDE